MKIIYAPEPFNVSNKTIFLAGTIDNGNSDDWQSQVAESLSDLDVTLLNPRRPNWDSTLKQSITNVKFREQVEWELSSLESSNYILMYFAASSKSPISLLELGLYADSKKMIIICPNGFWRKGNVEIVANKYNIPLFNDLDAGIIFLKTKFL